MRTIEEKLASLNATSVWYFAKQDTNFDNAFKAVQIVDELGQQWEDDGTTAWSTKAASKGLDSNHRILSVAQLLGLLTKNNPFGKSQYKSETPTPVYRAISRYAIGSPEYNALKTEQLLKLRMNAITDTRPESADYNIAPVLFTYEVFWRLKAKGITEISLGDFYTYVMTCKTHDEIDECVEHLLNPNRKETPYVANYKGDSRVVTLIQNNFNLIQFTATTVSIKPEFADYFGYFFNGAYTSFVNMMKFVVTDVHMYQTILTNPIGLAVNFLDTSAKIDIGVKRINLENKKSESYSLQQIHYGAPGTGKSHTINRETKGHKTFRITFHPDSDYSTFVGAYKPVMEEVETRVVPVVLNNGTIFDQNNGTLREKKISYKFVKQAFMKAYIAAWRTFTNNSDVAITSQAPSPISLTYKNQTWILTEVANDRVLYTKEDVMSVDEYKKNVLTYWPMMPEFDDKGKIQIGTFDHYHAAGCTWYKKIHGKDHSADECWEAIWNVLEAGGTIEATPNSQTYSISLRGGEIVAITRDNKAYKSTIMGCFETVDADSSVQKRIAKELKEFNANDFDKAWEELKRRVNGVETPESTNTTEIPPVFLIIEEINRGNCAQIFGDLFQLLDRKEGFSQYPIHADDDIRKCLVNEHSDEDPSFGTNGLVFSDEQKKLINSVLDCEDDVAAKIACGEVLALPPNLYIWATMNTSDQSLFPIDSAFKRRWDWKYRPIVKGRDETGNELNWRIAADTKEYDWWSFLEKINAVIGSTTNSEDKKLGFFFCKPTDGVISAETFVGKVIFYIWNDVFKNFGFDDPIFKDEDNSTLEFDKFYTTNAAGDTIVRANKVEKFLDNLQVMLVGEVIIDMEDEDGNTSSSSIKDYTKYSINGVGKYGKNRLAAECVREYIKKNPTMSAEEVWTNWKSLGYIVPHFIESLEEYNARTDTSKRSTELECSGTTLYVEHNGYGKNGAVDKLIAAVNQKGWDIRIEKVDR